jgi:hypothetical protein
VIKRICALALLASGLAACAGEGPAPAPSLPPPPPPHRPLAAIVGHGDYHTRSGAHGDCAGRSVALMYDTPSFHARMAALYGSAQGARLTEATVKSRAAGLGPSDSPLAASTSCGDDGRFSFPTLAPGPYFLIARVKVTSVAGAQTDLVIMRHLDLADGETRDVSLAP